MSYLLKITPSFGFVMLAAVICFNLAGQQDDYNTLIAQVADLSRKGKYADAIPVAQRALRAAEEQNGPRHETVAITLGYLAGFYEQQGDEAKAELFFRRILSIYEDLRGTEDLYVATTANNLGLACKRQGKNAEAEVFYKRALAITEMHLGPDDPRLADYSNNLARLYDTEGQYSDAERLYKRALTIRQKAFGLSDPRVVTSLRNLALSYDLQKRFADAEPLYQNILDIQEKALGATNLRLVAWILEAANTYLADGRFGDAELLYKRAINIQENSLGPDHIDVALTMTNLATAHFRDGKYSVAEPLFLRALQIREKDLAPDDSRVATSLINLSLLYSKQRKHAEGNAALERALNIWKTRLMPTYAEAAASLDVFESIYQNISTYPDSEMQLYSGFEAIAGILSASAPADIAGYHNHLARMCEQMSKYVEAEALNRRALRITEDALGVDDQGAATSANNLALILRKRGKYPEAEALYKRAQAIYQKTSGPDSISVAGTLANLAVVYQHEGRSSDADQLFRRSLVILERTPESVMFPVVLYDLAKLSAEGYRYDEAEQLYKRGIRIAEEHPGHDALHPALIKVDLASLYGAQGKYAEALQLGREALGNLEAFFGPEHPKVAVCLIVLADLSNRQGNYSDAEEFYRRALAISEKSLVQDDPDLATALVRMAEFYDLQGQYGAAEQLIERALRMCENAFGPDSADVAVLCNDLGMLRRELGKYADAEALYRRALRISEAESSPNELLEAASLNGLGGLFGSQGLLAAAEPLYVRALSLIEKLSAQISSDGGRSGSAAVAASLNNLAVLYYKEGKYSAAEPLFNRALEIMKASVAPNVSDVASATAAFAALYYAKGSPRQAEVLFEQSFGNLAHQFNSHFSYMTEGERLLFVQTVADRFSVYFSFCVSYRDENPALLGKMYDLMLLEKGLVINSVESQRTRLSLDGNVESLTLFDQLRAGEIQLATLRLRPPRQDDQWKKTIDELEQKTDAIQRELARRSSRIAVERGLSQANWRDVQLAIGKDEAAVEVLRFPFREGAGDSEKDIYVALVLTAETTLAPKFISLGSATELEGPAINEYRKLAKLEKDATLPDRPGFYQAFWKPLEPLLSGKKRVFISADGVLNQVSLAIVSDGQGQLLIEKYDLRMVSSTRDILRGQPLSVANSAILIGNPAFDLTEAEQRQAVAKLRTANAPGPIRASSERAKELEREPTTILRDGGAGSPVPDGARGSSALEGLPGTKEELNSVRRSLDDRGWKVEVYSEGAALKEAITGVSAPRILHVATHGFFGGDQGARGRTFASGGSAGVEDPMLKSGLFFAGANRLLRGEPSADDVSNGVLTAYEATAINLQGTELVVLSACDTGLGEVKSGEGVFGLRRALQEAGAQSVLMSMWSVPDLETKELMTLFYERWLAGADKQQALYAAQLEERKKVRARWGRDRPDLWGAFVLVGR